MKLIVYRKYLITILNDNLQIWAELKKHGRNIIVAKTLLFNYSAHSKYEKRG